MYPHVQTVGYDRDERHWRRCSFRGSKCVARPWSRPSVAGSRAVCRPNRPSGRRPRRRQGHLRTVVPARGGIGAGRRPGGTQRRCVPPNDSLARGQTIFRLSADGQELRYRLVVANLDNVTQAHIHLAPAGVNGPVVAWLYPLAPPAQLIPGRSSGVLATGTITEGDLVGPLAGQPLSALVDAMEAGDTYVNVHTSQFPPGEIRGQIR
jgi:hypothetical protein